MAVGDLTFGDHPLCVGFGAYSEFKNMSPSYPFERVQRELEKADILFGNLECAVSETGVPSNRLGSAQMKGDIKGVQALLNARFNVVNVANNHSMEHGKELFVETVTILEKNGIACCGVNLGTPQKCKPCVLEQKGIKMGFLGYSLRPRQHFSHDPLYAEGNPAAIENEVRGLKTRVDVLIVSLHWGDEFIDRPSPAEIRLARRICDAGADLIVGHHPHVLKGIENYRSQVIAYSLGNFVCDMIWLDPLRESVIFSCDIAKDGIRNIQLTPAFINPHYQPEILEGERAKNLLEKVQKLSAELNVEDLTNFEDKIRDYEREAAEVLEFCRRASHRYFLSHLHKYPIPILFQQVGGYLSRRIKGG